MSQTRANGTAGAAALLRQMADDLDRRPALLAGATLAPQSEVLAVVDSRDDAPGGLVVEVRIVVTPEHREVLSVEQELTHPGG